MHSMKLAWYEIRWSVGILDEKQLIAIGKFRSEFKPKRIAL